MSYSSKVTNVDIVDLTKSDDDEPPTNGMVSTAAMATLAAASKPIQAGPPMPTAAAALLSTAQIRRSGRDCKSTIIYIDGHAVKKTNNYSVKGGQYVHHDNSQYDTISPALKRRQQLQEDYASNKKKKAAPVVRQVSPQEVARREHNIRVQTSKAAKQDLRKAYLRDHASTLRPFVEDSIYQGLLSNDSEDMCFTYETLQVVDQPKLVTGGTLRDYQQAGLTFLVNNHRRNCGMILGDEMGLGAYL